jgi:hypothetical protein
MTPSRPDTVILDACLAITFGNAGALDLIAGIVQWDVVTAARAIR